MGPNEGAASDDDEEGADNGERSEVDYEASDDPDAADGSDDEFDSAVSEASDEEEEQDPADFDDDEDDPASRPSISRPSNVVDYVGASRGRSASPSAAEKGKAKAPLWTDPADEAARVDMEGDRRMRKLARGQRGQKGVGADGKVDGKELQRRLREQCVFLPCPTWTCECVACEASCWDPLRTHKCT